MREKERKTALRSGWTKTSTREKKKNNNEFCLTSECANTKNWRIFTSSRNKRAPTMCLQRFRFIVLKHKAWKRKKNSRHIYLVCRKMCVNVKCRVCVLVLYSVQVKFTEITFLSYTFNLEFLEIDWRTPETNQKNKKYTTIVDSLIATYAVEHIHYLVNEVKSEAQEMFDRHSLSESERESTHSHMK